jgi:hypothetical protein
MLEASDSDPRLQITKKEEFVANKPIPLSSFTLQYA